MSWDYPGFLAPRHRKYLAEEDGYDFSEHSNPSQFRKEIRQRWNGANQDKELLGASDIISREDLMQAPRNIHDPRGTQAPMTEQRMGEAQTATKAQAQSVGLETDSLEAIFGEMRQEMMEAQDEIKEADGVSREEMSKNVREIYRRLFAHAFVATIDGMLEGAAGSVDKKAVVEGLIKGAWPERDQVLETALQELSDD